MKRKGKIIVILITLSILVPFYQVQNSTAAKAIGNLVLKTNGGGVRPDYAWFIAKDLRDIGIEVTIRVEEWSVFYGTLMKTHDYDMGIVSVSGGSIKVPDMRNLFTKDGNLNVFGIDTTMPYGNLNEQMQEEGMLIMDPYERQEHYKEWQFLIMDKIIPLLPLFASQSYTGTWANTVGYHASWSITDSLPYMQYEGYHNNQESLKEFHIADANWQDLNPMFVDAYHGYELIGHVMNEELVQLSPGLEPLKTGLVTDWEFISDTHIKFQMRDNVYWAPSYNITERNELSSPLETIPNEDLMRGLKNNEYSTGFNQRVEAKDAVFTLLLWSNLMLSPASSYHEWISNIYVDPLDPLAFHIHIDGDPSTLEEAEIYPDIWSSLNWIVMPEFFLNSSDSTISYSSGGVKTSGLYPSMLATPQWRAYSSSQFGCGKYMLDYHLENTRTVLRMNPNWFGIGAIDGTEQVLDIQTIVVEAIQDSTEELSQFLHGNLDWTSLTDFPSIRRTLKNDPRFDVRSKVNSGMSFLFFNLQRPFIGGADNYVYLDTPGKEEYTKGIAIRKLMCYSINREEINYEVHNGEYLICHSTIYPSAEFYYNDVKKYNYDLCSAMEWLDSAGYFVDYPITEPDGNTTSETSFLNLLGVLSIIVFISKLISRRIKRAKL